MLTILPLARVRSALPDLDHESVRRLIDALPTSLAQPTETAWVNITTSFSTYDVMEARAQELWKSRVTEGRRQKRNRLHRMVITVLKEQEQALHAAEVALGELRMSAQGHPGQDAQAANLASAATAVAGMLARFLSGAKSARVVALHDLKRGGYG